MLEINTATNILTSMKVYVNGSTTASVDISNQALTSYDYTTLEFGYAKGRSTTNSTQRLEDINITQTTQAVSYANYTVHFVDGDGNKVKEDEVRNGQVETTVNANSDDQTTFYSDGVIANNSATDFAAATAKYTYASDGDGVEVKGDGSAEFTVTYTKHDKFTATASAISAGSTIKANISSATAYEGETAIINLQKYINVSDTWYTTTQDLFVNATAAGNTEVEYSASNVSYFFEYEDLTISRLYGDGYNGTSASNGRAVTMYGGGYANTESTVAPGVYTVSLNGLTWQNGYADTYEIAYSTDKTNWIPVGYIVYPNGEEGVKTLEGAIIPTESYIRVWATMGTQTPRRHLDYLVLEKTSNLPDNATKTVTAAGWATYCSPYILDFSSTIEHLDAAYIVTGGAGGVLTKTEVTGAVPAGTGLLLKGNGECVIPVAASSTFDVTANKLEGKTAEYALAAEGGYVLMNDATNGLGFYLNANAFTVGANTAYLPAGFDASGARPAFFWFGDDTTDINAVQATETVSKNYYNLSGQRVAQPTKGLYIVNGKKVIIK